MARLPVLYATPPNPAPFDQHYANVRHPPSQKLPGLQHFDIGTGPIHSPPDPRPPPSSVAGTETNSGSKENPSNPSTGIILYPCDREML